jgi:hypothetical protein
MFFPVFLMDLSGEPCSSNFLINDICDAVARSEYLLFADDIKFTEPLNLLRTANYFSLTLTLYKVGALLTV